MKSFASPQTEPSPSVPQFREIEAQPLVGAAPQCVSDMSDAELRAYEADSFHSFQATRNPSAIHSMAAAIVELHRRGLSLKGDWQ